MAIFAKNPVFEGFDLQLQFLSLVLAENFLKSSPNCLLACVSKGTHGKIQNWGFFLAKKVSKNGNFCQKFYFLKVLTNNFNFCH